MKAFVFIFLQCFLLSPVLKAQVISNEKEFLGIRLGVTTLGHADSLLNEKSFRPKKESFKSIKWRGGGCSTLFKTHYFIKTNKSKIELILMGYETVFKMEIINIKSGGDVQYLNLILGRTKRNELKDATGKWEQEAEGAFEKSDFYVAQFQNIKIGVKGRAGNKKRIMKFILTK